MSPRLEELDLMVTGECNLRCGFCSVDAGHGPGLSPTRIRGLVDEAADLGLQELHLTGGEPTLRPDLEEVVRHAVGRRLQVRVITNGTLLPKDRLKRLLDAGLRSLMVSIDGLEATHDRMRGVPGTWRKAVQCVEDALDLGFRTRVSAVAFQGNLAELPPLLALSADLGVHVFSVFLGSPLGRGAGWIHRVVPPAPWSQFLGRMEAAVKAGTYGPHIQVVMEEGTTPWAAVAADLGGRGAGCRTLASERDYLLVRPDGGVTQCVFLLHDMPPLGNLLEEPLAAIVERDAPYAWLSRLPPDCRGCDAAPACGGGCRGLAFLHTGAWIAVDPRCETSPQDLRAACKSCGEDSRRKGGWGGNPERVSPPLGCGRSPLCDQGARLPLCPIAKRNLRTGRLAGSSEEALRGG